MSASAVYVLDLKGKVRPRCGCGLHERRAAESVGRALGSEGPARRGSPALLPCGRRFPFPPAVCCRRCAPSCEAGPPCPLLAVPGAEGGVGERPCLRGSRASRLG